MTDDDDRDLRRWFGAQRREELGAAPPFGRMWAAARRPRRPRRRVGFAVAAAALALAGLWLRTDRRPATESLSAPSVAQWRSPTEFLLDTPGRDLLSAVPALESPSVLGLGLPMPPPKPSGTPKGERS